MVQQHKVILKSLGLYAYLHLCIADNNEKNISTTTNSRKRSYTEDTTVEEKKERKGRKAPHELLTDAEKKANHIASEKKRRQNIRLGFDQLIEIVPSLTQGNRSEAFILQKCKLERC